MACGSLAMSEHDFLTSTLRHLDNRYRGWARVNEMREQAAWERARYTACILLTPHMKKGKSVQPQDLGKFPWEETPEFKGDAGAVLDKWDTALNKK